MPHPRNPFFTGREDVLTNLQATLATGTPAALTQPQAISGLGGIGKTQTAVEYAYRHQDEYQAVFWVSAVDDTTLREGFVEVARLLGLPQAQEADQSLAVQAVKVWLEREGGWLLLLDNADEPKAVKPFLPSQKKGHVLLTTRASATGTLAQKVEIGKLSEDDGALLLLRRAKIVGGNAPLDAADAEDKEAARALSRTVDGLPLALDQAGAFIEETQSSPAWYLGLYGTEAAELLAEYGDSEDRDHASVRVTFSLAFAKVATASPAAGELIRFCAFLAPDAIPEEIFNGGDAVLNGGPGLFGVSGLAWEKIIGVACRYSLLSRDADARTLSIHRLVQTVIRHEMDEGVRRACVERVVSAVNRIFPDPEFSNWPLCERLLPHARECAAYNTNGYAFDSIGAARLLNVVGHYLHKRSQYTEVEPLFKQALLIYEKSRGAEHPDTAISLSSLAGLYKDQGRYAEALPLYRRALLICEKKLVPDHPDTATILNNLALFYDSQGRFEEALPLLQRALQIREKVLKPDHPDTAASLDNLAILYRGQGRYEEALLLNQRALTIWEQVLEPDNPDVAVSLNNLASLYQSLGRYAEALPLLQRALAICQTVLGPDDTKTATSLNNLAIFYKSQGDYEAALPLYQRALAITEKSWGPEHSTTATCLNNLAYFYMSQGDYGAAEPLLKRALAIVEKALEPEHPTTKLFRENYTLLLGQIKQQ